MYYGARQGVHGFSPSGFEIHYGELPQKKTGLLILVAVFVALASAFSGMMYKANHISYGLVADFHPIPTAATAPKAAPGEDPATAAATAALPDTPADPIDRSADLQAALDGWLGAHTNRQWAVSFVGLRGDPTKASTRPLERMGLASVYKLLMLYPLVQKLPRAQWDSTFVNANGTSKTVSACVELMLLNSDNPCGEGVANYIGWAKADKALAGLGLTHTYIDRTDDSSAGDVATYIQLMDEGKLFSADDTAYFEKLLATQRFRSGIPAGCPTCIVSDKIGDTGFVRNDAGLVQYGDNQAYSLVIMSNGASYGEIADLTSTLQAVMTSN